MEDQDLDKELISRLGCLGCFSNQSCLRSNCPIIGTVTVILSILLTREKVHRIVRVLMVKVIHFSLINLVTNSQD